MTKKFTTVQPNGRAPYYREYFEADGTGLKTKIGILKNSTKGTNLVPGDRVMFSKSSKVPRYKFAEYAKNHNMSRVISKEKATAVVVDLDALINRANASIYKMTVCKFPKAYMGIFCNHSLPDVLYIQPNYIKMMDALIPGFSKHTLEQVEMHYTYYADEAEGIADVAKLADIITQVKVLSDKSVLEQINDGIEIDKDVYEQLRQMFIAGGKDNVSLAMELMANSDYSKSELKIALLLNEFWMSKMYGNPYRNLVNFKSLLLYFDKYGWSKGPVEFAEGIIKTTTDSMPDREERIELAKKNVLNWINERVPSTVFSVEEVKIKV